jgi:hypothetical protein
MSICVLSHTLVHMSVFAVELVQVQARALAHSQACVYDVYVHFKWKTMRRMLQVQAYILINHVLIHIHTHICTPHTRTQCTHTRR